MLPSLKSCDYVVWGEDEIADSAVAIFSVFLFKNSGARRQWKEDELQNQEYRKLLTKSRTAGRLAFVESVNQNLAALGQMVK